jgi:hypothetical protein
MNIPQTAAPAACSEQLETGSIKIDGVRLAIDDRARYRTDRHTDENIAPVAPVFA